MERHLPKGIGIDLVEVSRFETLVGRKKEAFFHKVFTEKEIAYCLKHKNPAEHFAGIFAAKEAASKALGTEKYPFIELEVRHDKNGAPEIWQKTKKIAVRVSISHTSTMAAAIAAA